jgi:1,4-alpha-glucan branching enzyme
MLSSEALESMAAGERRSSSRRIPSLALRLGKSLNVFHVDNGNKTLGYHRWENGGGGDDVVVVANFSNVPLRDLNIGFPRGGRWLVRFNSGANVYDPGFTEGDSFDTMANPGAKDGLNFNANVGVGAYSVVILSQ